jgi:SAM-dependent methyltransferase
MRNILPRLPSPACAVLSRFFIIRDPVPEHELVPALGGPSVLAAFEQAGLAERVGFGVLRCPFVMIPAAGVMAFSDAIEDPVDLSLPDDYIIPVSPSSRFTDDLTVRTLCELSVDMGCGQGFLSLRNMGHSVRCIATDINPRALAFARANAAFNGRPGRLDCRLGSFFEPISDVIGQVDLFTCNPPFFIQSGHSTIASAASGEGDSMVEELVRQMPRWLREGSGTDGGWGTIIGIWEHAQLADWVSRPRTWLENNGCDALLLRFHSFTADEYLRYAMPPDEIAESEPAWRELCQRRGIGALTYGGFVLKKRQGRNWFRSVVSPITIRSGTGSEQLRAYFAAQTLLESGVAPETLLERRLRAAPGWRYDPAFGLPKMTPSSVPLGLAWPVADATQKEPVVATFDGTRPARQSLEVLMRMGLIAQAADHPASIELVRSLLAEGCLELAD